MDERLRSCSASTAVCGWTDRSTKLIDPLSFHSLCLVHCPFFAGSVKPVPECRSIRAYAVRLDADVLWTDAALAVPQQPRQSRWSAWNDGSGYLHLGCPVSLPMTRSIEPVSALPVSRCRCLSRDLLPGRFLTFMYSCEQLFLFPVAGVGPVGVHVRYVAVVADDQQRWPVKVVPQLGVSRP